MSYRADIDGLRAVAVIPVILYHAGISAFGGGYVGVDVFFVISGYLITRMIADEAREGRFSIATFYERRIRRIFPAFFMMVACVSALAWFVVTPNDFKEFGKSVVAAAGFGSNVLFWLQEGYFDGPAHLKPMLHTWSLAVEEQFYIVFPLLLVALNRWQRAHVTRWVVVLLVGSLAACVFVTTRNPSTAFYQAPLRGWELLVGSALALGAVPELKHNGLRQAAAVLGLGMIAFSVLVFTDATAFPGTAALCPVLGAALVIHTGRTTGPQTAVAAFLSRWVVVFVGKISYSLYLWHWPLLVLAGYWFLEPLSTAEMTGVLVLTAIVSIVSWKYVEQPFRHPPLDRAARRASRRKLFAGAVVATAVLVGFGISTVLTRGWPSRVSDQVNKLDRARKDYNPDRPRCHAQDEKPIRFEDKCVYGRAGVAPSVAIWGDSFAPELAVALGHEAERNGAALLYISYSNCPPAFGIYAQKRPRCDEHNHEMAKRLAESTAITKVILVARYEVFYKKFGARFLEGFDQVASVLAAAGKDVIVVYPIPQPSAHVPTLLAHYAHTRRDLHDAYISRSRYEADNAGTIAFLDALVKRRHLRAVHLTDRLCDAQRCEVFADGTPLYYDENHLSLAGAAYTMPAFGRVFAPN